MDDLKARRSSLGPVLRRIAATGGMAAGLALAACSSASPSTIATPSPGLPTAAISPVGASQPPASALVATVVVSAMATSVAVIPDLCEGPGATPDKPNRYTFTVTTTLTGTGDVTDRYAQALLGKVAHVALNGPPDAGSYDSPIVHGPTGAGLSIIVSGGFCQPDRFSTLASLAIDGVPLTQQSDGTWSGTISVN